MHPSAAETPLELILSARSALYQFRAGSFLMGAGTAG